MVTMKTKGKTPETHAPNVSNVQLNIGKPTSRNKDRYFHSPIQQKIYDLFQEGGKYSVVELCQMLNVSDPRSHIRYIRNAGVRISDYWVETEFSRHKIYFMHCDKR